MAGALLEWLQVLAEEYNSNFKLEVKNDFGRGGDKSVERGSQVIGLLSMYVSAEGKLMLSSMSAKRAPTLFLQQASPRRCTTNASPASAPGFVPAKQVPPPSPVQPFSPRPSPPSLTTSCLILR